MDTLIEEQISICMALPVNEVHTVLGLLLLILLGRCAKAFLRKIGVVKLLNQPVIEF